MNGWRRNTAIISKLRVTGEQRDGLEIRLRLENTLAATDFTPAGLPPQTILCVKKLRDPQPETLRLNNYDVTRPDVWRSSLAREIERLYRRAARPVRETVPAQAESVVFADDAELLACLATDWCENILAGNWWWRGLFPNLQTAHSVAQIWISSTESAPAALEILAQTKRAVPFMSKLQPSEVKGLLRQIILVFGLEHLRKVMFETIAEKPDLQFENSFFAAPPKNAPWLAFAPETEVLSPDFERQSLLGIGLMLARAPRIVRSSEFARQVENLRRAPENRAKISPTEAVEIFVRSEKKRAEIPRKSGEKHFTTEKKNLPPDSLETETSPVSENKAAQIFAEVPPVEKHPAENADFPKAAQPEFASPKNLEKSNDVSFESSVSEIIFRRQESGTKTEIKQFEKLPIHQVFAEESVVETDDRERELSVETDFGGVFYLLNLGLYLKLYRDFADTETMEIDLNIWDFVALLSLELTDGQIENDVVWRLLAQLAGRESDYHPAKNFNAPNDWRMPPEWLKTFPTDEKWTWAKTEKRLVVRHPSGFSIIDIERRGGAENQLNDELKIYRRGFSESAANDFPNIAEASKTWLKNLTEYVEIRLRQALNLPADEEAISAVLLERRATIVVTATHLDVTFRLADLPFAVRFSGLDRDAGWIPAAGKYVKFHYI
jgi:hypothetical protein